MIGRGHGTCPRLLYSTRSLLSPPFALYAGVKRINGEVVNVLIRLGIYLWQTEDGRAMRHRLLHEFRTTAPCETKLPPIEPEEDQG
jgi:hypothetical protein